MRPSHRKFLSQARFSGKRLTGHETLASPEPYLKIGDVARQVGVSPSVIRSWESLGLARPRRTESKYRLYTAEDVKLLKRARFLRKVRGLNAAAIVQLLKREGTRAARRRMAMPRPIGAHLRQLRAKRRLSLAQVARAVGISVGFLSALERSQMSGSVGNAAQAGALLQNQHSGFFRRRARPAACKCARRSARFWKPARGAHGTAGLGQHGDGAAFVPRRAARRAAAILHARGRRISVCAAGRTGDHRERGANTG